MRTIWIPITAALLTTACATDQAAVSVDDAQDTQSIDEGADELEELDDDDGADGGGGDEEDQDDGEDPPFASSGSWQTLIETMSFDDCGMGEWVTDGPGSVIEIEVTGEQTFDLTHSRGTETCVVDGADFTCDTRYSTDTTAQDDYGLDALIELEMDAYGTFRSSVVMEWHTAIEADCSGDSCWLVSLTTSSFPCDMASYVEAQAL